MHVAVVGTGIVGVCTAAWLQRDGHQVTFIDPREAFARQGFLVAGSTPQEFRAFIETEIPKWARIIKAGGVTLQ